MPPFALTGKTIVVTGANRGIGLEFARQLVGRPGNRIIAGVRRPDNATALKELGSAIQVFPLDVTDPTSIERFADEVKKTTPHVDVLINNAGVIGQALSLDQVTKEAMVDVFVANTVGPLLTVRALHQRALLGGEAGSLVATVTSKMGSIADCSSGYYDYRASKAAVNVVNKALAGDLGRDNVTLTLLHPGYVKTDMTGGKGNIDATTSVHGMLTVLESGSDLQGTWHAWDGQQVPW